jgi:RNA polymerase sigma-70 factor (ECF subfamily)
MIDEKILVWRFNRGSKDALRRIYEKYKDDLLALALTLLRDRSMAEDVVHDVFVAFAAGTGAFRLSGTLNGYLSTCVANCARDRNRLKAGRNAGLDGAEAVACGFDGPLESAARREESGRLNNLLAHLPYEQREVLVLHLQHQMRFREIARSLGVSINTVQSRYRYGLDKLRSVFNSTVTE